MAGSVDILDRCKDLIKHVQYLVSAENPNPPQINKQQCELLAEKLPRLQGAILKFEVETYRELLANKETEGSEFASLMIPAAELNSVLERITAIIEECCCGTDGWLNTALKQGDLKETFSEILYDSKWHEKLICSILLTSITFDKNVFQTGACEGKLSVVEYLDLLVAAKQDQETLKNRLRDLKKNHECDEDDERCEREPSTQCLATQLLAILNVKPSDIAIDSSGLTSSPLIFWVSPNELSGGDVLGKGGFGVVRETTWLGMRFAKKEFRGGDNKFFRQEVGALAGLNHPHVVRLVCCAMDKRSCSLVMELMDTDLYDFLEAYRENIPSGTTTKNSPFSHIQCVDLMLQIAEGIRYIHSKGLAHRDLKSPNILIKFPDPSKPLGPPEPSERNWTLVKGNDSGCNNSRVFLVKVADFGLTKIKNASTRYSHMTLNTGTRKWMAPEVYKVKDYDEDEEQLPDRFQPFKTDVYSFGIVCFELLTGEEPFANSSQSGLYRRLKGGERPPIPVDCPARLTNLIQRCWDGNPRNRPEFHDICKELRYIKGLLLLVWMKPMLYTVDRKWLALQNLCDLSKLGKVDAPTFQMEGAQVLGPWGGQSGNHFFDGLVTSLKRIRLTYGPDAIRSIVADYEVSGTKFTCHHGNRRGIGEIAEIAFNSPSEFLMQIEGWFGITSEIVPQSNDGGTNPITCLKSLTFRTNFKTYGPYGNSSARDTQFKSDTGRILGFYGKSGLVIDALGVFMAVGES